MEDWIVCQPQVSSKEVNKYARRGHDEVCRSERERVCGGNTQDSILVKAVNTRIGICIDGMDFTRFVRLCGDNFPIGCRVGNHLVDVFKG